MENKINYLLNWLQKKSEKVNYHLFDDDSSVNANLGIEVLKDKIFELMVWIFIISGPILLVYGALLFYREGKYISAFFEIFFYFSTILVILKTNLKLSHKKFYFLFMGYFISFMVLINTGYSGAGMISLLVMIVISGIILKQNQIIYIIYFELFAFMVVTYLLYSGIFDNFPIADYKATWLIKILTLQILGLWLVFLNNTIYRGIEQQFQVINKNREKILESEQQYELLLNSTTLGIGYFKLNGELIYWNEEAKKTTGGLCNKGLETTELSQNNLTIYDIFSHEEAKKHMIRIGRAAASENENNYEDYYECNGEKKWFLRKYGRIMNSRGNDIGVQIIRQNISEQKRNEEKLRYLSYHDHLTGMFNRRYWEEEKQTIDQAQNLPIAVIMADINGLKLINDAFGHEAGDWMIKKMAELIGDTFVENSTVARTGGDEFSVLLLKTDYNQLYKELEQLKKNIRNFNENLEDEANRISVALGSAIKSSEVESLNDTIKMAETLMNQRKLLEENSSHSNVMASIKATMFEKSHETEDHAERLVEMSKRIGQSMRLSQSDLDHLELLAMLHDIGKIGVDDRILGKKGKLTQEEWLEMRKHPEIGYRIAMASTELIPIAEYILSHHERWDGTGYPRGLQGEKIPLLSRILAVVDAYDAMIEDRVYRQGIEKMEALEEILKNAGTQFDPEIVKIFYKCIMELEREASKRE